MNSQNCSIKRVYLIINNNQFKLTIYGNNSDFIRKYRPRVYRQD